MAGHPSQHDRLRNDRGFTLVELLVVIAIIALVSAVALPTVLPALSNRQVGEAARLLQAMIAGARDSAIRNNAPRGIRLIPDLYLGSNASNLNQPNASSRIIMIEPASDLTDGLATFVIPSAAKQASNNTPQWLNAGNPANPPLYQFPYLPNVSPQPATITTLWGFYPYPLYYTTAVGQTPASQLQSVLIVEQAVYNPGPGGVGLVPNPPTNWFWNVRIGDKFRFNDSGQYYTVVGPMTVVNPEFFVNDGKPGISTLQDSFVDSTGTVHAIGPGANPATPNPEFLFLVNGVDDDGDGYIDEGFDGVDQNMNFALVNGTSVPTPDDFSEWGSNASGSTVGEVETWVGSQYSQYFSALTSGITPPGKPYVITRRPVPVPGGREVSLPGTTVVDLTTVGGSFERSRLPVDPFTGNVDVLLNQAGQVVPTTAYSSPSSYAMSASFLHFWIADRTDVHDPVAPTSGTFPYLPMPANTPGFPPANNPTLGNSALKKEMQLVTLYARTGQVVTNEIANFSISDVNAPFYDAQHGTREAK